MSWNFRIIRTPHADASRYALHEVYYRDGHPQTFNAEATTIAAEDTFGILSLRDALDRACQRPVLELSDGVLREVEPPLLPDTESGPADESDENSPNRA
jgi:hypothetical protein